MQSLAKLEIQVDQSVITISGKEKGELPSQPESKPEGYYLAKSFHVPINFSEQSIMTLENEMIIEQPYTTKTINTNNLTKAEIYMEKLD